MPENSDYDYIDIVSPFLRSIMNNCIGSTSKSVVTKMCIVNVDRVNLFKRRSIPDEWTTKRLFGLKCGRKEFNIHAHKAFLKYQATEIRTFKFHSLDHTVKSLCHMCSAEYLYGILYDHSHKNIEETFKLTSKRRRTAMDEIPLWQKRMLWYCRSCDSDDEISKKPPACRFDSVRPDAKYLIRSGQKLLIEEME